MLAMVASIAELRVGIAMPETTAALYETAAKAMLGRAGTPPSEAAKALLQAILFEAHATEQRIVTMEHVTSAARWLGDEGAAQEELLGLVRKDQVRVRVGIHGLRSEGESPRSRSVTRSIS